MSLAATDGPTGGAFLRAFGGRHCYLSAGEEEEVEEGLSFLFVDLPPQAPQPPAIKVFSPPTPLGERGISLGYILVVRTHNSKRRERLIGETRQLASAKKKTIYRLLSAAGRRTAVSRI